MDLALFNNNASTTLAAPITNVATVLTVVPGAGALFPNPGAGQYFIMTLVDQATRLINEIVHVTQCVGDVMTIVRGQESTTPLAWSAGDIAAQLPTAGTYALFSQLPQSQAQAFNYAQDTGTANNYVAAFSPVITQRITGLIMRVKATNANSGASTLDAGAGPISITNPDGSALGTGAIVANGIFEVIDPGSGPYQLTSSSQQAQSSAGAATTGDVKWRPTSETITGWVIANTTTIGNAASNATQRANADAANLFAWHWNNFSNTVCPVYTSAGAPTTRGANAAADFAANKQIATYEMRGRAQIGVDTMGAGATTYLSGVPVTTGSTTTPGSVIGENLHTLVLGEIPSHRHSVYLNDPGHTHSYLIGYNPTAFQGSGGGQNFFYAYQSATTGSSPTGITVRDTAGGAGTANQTALAGGGGAHNIVALSATGYFYLKL